VRIRAHRGRFLWMLLFLIACHLHGTTRPDSLALRLSEQIQRGHLRMPAQEEETLIRHLLTLQYPATQGFAWLWWAELAEHQGFYIAADTLYRHAYRALPESLRGPVLLRRIHLHLQEGQLDTARVLLQRALQGPTPPDLHVSLRITLARLCLATGRAQEALATLQGVPESQRLQGFALYQLGRYAEALERLRPLEDDTSRLLQALAAYRLGRNLWVTQIPRQGVFHEALTLLAGLAYLRRAVTDSAQILLQGVHDPALRPYARYGLAALDLRLGHPLKVVQELGGETAPPTLAPLFRFLEAQALGFSGQLLEALARFRSLEFQVDSSWHAFYRLKYAETLLRAGQPGPARSQIRAIVGPLPDSLARHRRFLEAVAAFQENNYAQAYRWLQRLQNEAPPQWTPYVHYLLGLVAYRQGYYGLAQRNLQQALVLPELRQQVLLYLGDCAFNLRQYRRAETWFREAWQRAQRPEVQREALWGMALSLYRQRRYTEAAQWLEHLVRNWPNAPHTSLALYLMATSWEMAGDLDKALRALETLHAQASPDLQDRILLERANLLYNHEQYPKALAAYFALIERFPTSPLVDQALEGLFWTAQKMHRTDTLGLLLTQLRQQIPTLRTLLLLREAQFRYNIGEYDRALALADTFLAVGADTLHRQEALWTAGMAAYRLGQCQRALDYFTALRGHEEADFRRAECWAKLGKTREALRAFRAFLQHHALSTFRPQALYQVALLSLAEGDSATADTFFARLYHQYPRHPLTDAALVAWAPLVFQRGQREQAIALLDSVIQRHSDELAGQAWLTKGQLLREWGDLKGAVEAFITAATLFESVPGIAAPALWQAAETYEKMDRLREAIVAYRRYARKYPQNPRAREAKIRANRLEQRWREMQGDTSISPPQPTGEVGP